MILLYYTKNKNSVLITTELIKVKFMNIYFDILKLIRLFEKICEEDLEKMLSCLGAKVIDAQKGQFVLNAGEPVNYIGIILEGKAHVIKENLDGQRVIISVLECGDFFGEAFCCTGTKESPVSVVTVSNVKIMLLEFNRILKVCSKSCSFHTQIIENMLYVIANKNIILQNRIDIISQKTLRMKVLTFLESMSCKKEKNITIPLNREEMSNFLCVDRSALSHELSRMKKSGLIDYYKNNFRLLI